MNLVYDLDKRYSGVNAIVCPNEGTKVMLEQSKVISDSHGNLVVHGSGAYLVCGRCGTKYPTARI